MVSKIMKKIIIGFVLLFLLQISGLFAAEFYEELNSRAGVTQPIYVVKPDKPVATVILLPGGTAKTRLGPDGPKKEGNFLVRTRDLFAENGLTAVVVDAPSDLIDTSDGLKGNRITREHVADIKAVVAYARKQTAGPVWLVGTSRGTISATHVAASEPALVNGIVLTATVSNDGNKGLHSVMDVALEKIRVPVLLAHHKKDNCKASPHSGVKKVAKRLTSAKLVDTMVFEGGKEKPGKHCAGPSYHGFLNIEDKVVADISNWIKTH
jgi:pimeloyl-ACP methyl ester carboxylesterase